MADTQSGQWRTSGGAPIHIKEGLQPARVQFVPTPRPAGTGMQPPPAASSTPQK